MCRTGNVPARTSSCIEPEKLWATSLGIARVFWAQENWRCTILPCSIGGTKWRICAARDLHGHCECAYPWWSDEPYRPAASGVKPLKRHVIAFLGEPPCESWSYARGPALADSRPSRHPWCQTATGIQQCQFARASATIHWQCPSGVFDHGNCRTHLNWWISCHGASGGTTTRSQCCIHLAPAGYPCTAALPNVQIITVDSLRVWWVPAHRNLPMYWWSTCQS